MKSKINYKALIPYFICTITYSFAAIMNVHVMEQIWALKELPNSELDNIYYYDILGYVLGAIGLLFSGRYFSLRQIAIFNLLVYILSVFNIGFFNLPDELNEIYSMIYSGTNLVIITILFCYIFTDSKIHKTSALSFFLFSISFAYFLVEIISPYEFFKVRNLAKINIVAISIFLFVFVLNPVFSAKTKIVANDFSILRNIELELLSAFTVFYTIMTIFYGYEVYAHTHSLLMISVSNIKYYIFISMFFISIFVPNLLFKQNLYKINIMFIVILLSTFLTISFWNSDIYLGFFCWFIIGIVLYIFFWSNILILTEKFTSYNLQLSIILYSLAAAIGYYCGYITIKTIGHAIGEHSFLVSIYFVLFGLLSYYLYFYKKNNLGEW